MILLYLKQSQLTRCSYVELGIEICGSAVRIRSV